MSPPSNNWKDIPIHVQTEEAYSVGNTRELLAEIAARLEKLDNNGESGMIALDSLPFSPANTSCCARLSVRAKSPRASKPSAPVKS